jgi:heptosyltransferase-1
MSLFSQISASIYESTFRAKAKRRPPVAKPISITPGSRVLCFTCAGIGDTLTDSVVFRALRESYPDVHLGAVVHHRRRLLVEHNPFVDQIFVFEKGPFTFRRLAAELRAAGPWDAILQLRGNDPEPRCLSYLLDPDVTVSTPNMTQMSWLCGHNVEQPDWETTHGVEQTLRLARYIGADTLHPRLVYDVTEEERNRLEELMRRMLVGRLPRLVLQLGGGRRAAWRDWPVERYAELIRHCKRDVTCELFVLGGEDQMERIAQLDALFAGDLKPYFNLVGKLSLAESAALLASARVLVSTDTGIMHLGFAVGTRVVALIHCNNPSSRVGPYGYGDRHRVVQLPKPANYRTPSDADMGDIPADRIYRRIKELW